MSSVRSQPAVAGLVLTIHVKFSGVRISANTLATAEMLTDSAVLPRPMCVMTFDSEPPGQAATRIIAASVFSLAAVAAVLVQAGSTTGAQRDALVGLAAGSVALSWLAIHTLFMLRYARLYYSGAPGGIDFNQEQPPCYIDFAYLAFSLGMTFQVSDTNLQTSQIRATALRHALLSYLFGAVILATSINLVAGLASGS